MLLTLTRDIFASTTTLGRLSVTYDGRLAYTSVGWIRNVTVRPLDFGFVCEDEDRGLDKALPLASNQRLKVREETAIPVGEYIVRKTWSPKYGRDVMQLLDVPAFSGIRVHPGNDEADSAGCLLPGFERDVAGLRVLKSTPATAWLDARVDECEARGEVVRIRVIRDAAAWAAYSEGA